MEVLIQFLLILAEVFVAALTLFVSTRLSIVNHLVLPLSAFKSFALGVGIVFVIERVIYPFVDPLTKYPLEEVDAEFLDPHSLHRLIMTTD